MANFANDAILSLPTITGDGLFAVNVVVPNAPPVTGLFEPTVEHPSTSYSYPLMDYSKAYRNSVTSIYEYCSSCIHLNTLQ